MLTRITFHVYAVPLRFYLLCSRGNHDADFQLALILSLQSIRAWCKPFSTTAKQNCTKHELMIPKVFYNIASRAAQSNSVYVRVLKIPIVHADSVSKSFRQNFCFFARAVVVSAGGSILFRDNNGYKQRLGPPVPKRRQFCDLFSWARVLK